MYEVMYDSAVNSSAPASPYLWVFGWLIGATFVFLIVLDGRRSIVKRVFLSLFTVIWLILGSIGISNVASQKSTCTNWREIGHYLVTEGEISEFDPMPAGGHKEESFRLGDYKFSYSDFDVSRGCFNNAKSLGGPIDAGKKVRLFHSNGVIFRIEVWRDA
ncbi:hypothetical protein GCM10025770_12460 [Viridibacterium curvum]|uniref:Uncharacterized protein n=1 Tax=Viridibacterium curvum TaxID=1101404 RepID=A0ABP9QHM8_9RHOO